MATRVVVDPITRIEGHLRIEAQAENGRISKAWATSTQFRGIEVIMQGRTRATPGPSPSGSAACAPWFTPSPPAARWRMRSASRSPNANLIRNLVHGMQYIQDHVIHFYHLHALDWVDVVSALKADPPGTAAIARKVSPWPNNSETHYRGCRTGSRSSWRADNSDLHQRYWTSGLQAAPKSTCSRCRTTSRRSTGSGTSSGCTRSSEARTRTRTSWWVGWRCHQSRRHRHDQRRAADRRPRHDHPRPAVRGAGAGPTSWRSRVLQGLGGDRRGRAELSGRRRVSRRRPSETGSTSPRDRARPEPEGVALRSASRSRSTSPAPGTSTPRATMRATPLRGETKAVRRPAHALEVPPGLAQVHLDEGARYDGRVMEGGRWPERWWASPPATKRSGDGQGSAGPAAGRPEALLHAGAGRRAGPGDRAALPADERWYDRLVDRIRKDTRTFDGSKWEPSAGRRGAGLRRRPGLGHWVQIENGKISRYQCVVPSTWNCSPAMREPMGPYEAALVGQPPAGAPGATSGDPPDHPLVRPLHGLRRPRAGYGRQPDHGDPGQ